MENTKNKCIEVNKLMENSRHIDKMEISHHQQQQQPASKEQNLLDFTTPSSPTYNENCKCGSAEKLSEVIKVNHYWQKDYTTLMEENNQYKARLYNSEKQRHLLQQENRTLREKIQQYEVQETLKTDSPSSTPSTPITGPSSLMPNVKGTYSLDDIEALKQQLTIYREDFLQEKEDRIKLSNENSQMKLELQKAKSIIEKLTVKSNTLKENYKRVNTEKEHIIRELRRLSSATSSATLPFLPITTDHTLTQCRANSPETLRSEDVIAHSGKNNPRGFYGGYVERDGLTLTAETK